MFKPASLNIIKKYKQSVHLKILSRYVISDLMHQWKGQLKPIDYIKAQQRLSDGRVQHSIDCLLNIIMSEDKKIRQSLFKRDKDFNETLKKQMEQQENMLKGYFKQYKKPVAQDPTIMKRDTSQDRTMLLKQILSPFLVFQNFYEEYWNLQCATPEENYILNLCKQHTKKQIALGIVGSLALTSLLSYRLRMSMSLKVHMMGSLVGLTNGILYGIITSSRYTLEKFQSLGEGYALGRSTVMEIQKYRMDKPK